MNLLAVEKPARYMGGEMGSIRKDDANLRIALAFPDVYEVGMSHLGLRILYRILNDMDGIAGGDRGAGDIRSIQDRPVGPDRGIRLPGQERAPPIRLLAPAPDL